MDTIIQSFVELLKYKIVHIVNTGDAVVDNSLRLIVITIVTLLITYGRTNITNIKIPFFNHKQNGIITDFSKIDRTLANRKFKFQVSFRGEKLVSEICNWIFKT